MTHRSRLCHFVIDVDDLDQGVTFWSAALDAKEEQLGEASRHVYRRLRLPDSTTRILLQRTDDPKSHKERMHPDLETDNVEAEVQRLEALGATLRPPTRTRLRLLGPPRPLGQRVLRPPGQLPRPPRPAPNVA